MELVHSILRLICNQQLYLNHKNHLRNNQAEIRFYLPLYDYEPNEIKNYDREMMIRIKKLKGKDVLECDCGEEIGGNGKGVLGMGGGRAVKE